MDGDVKKNNKDFKELKNEKKKESNLCFLSSDFSVFMSYAFCNSRAHRENRKTSTPARLPKTKFATF